MFNDFVAYIPILLKPTKFQNMAMLAHLKIEEEKYAAIDDLCQKEIEMQNRVQKNCSSLNVSKLKQYCTQLQLEKPNEDLVNSK